MMVRTLMFAMLIMGAGGAVVRAESGAAEGYRVMAYDGRTHQYTIHRNGTFDGKYLVKKIVVVCQSYQSGKQTPVHGATACSLPVGSFYPGGMKALTSWGDHVTVTEQNDWFNLTEGQGENRVSQSFEVVSIEVLPDNGCR